MKFQQISTLKEKGHSISVCCSYFNVSESGYYAFRSRTPSKRRLEDETLKVEILSIHKASKKTYGVPRIHNRLQNKGKQLGKTRVSRLMREEGLSAKSKKRFIPKTTVSDPSSNKAPRIYQIETAKVTKTNQVWASDLTYIPTKEGFMYLVVILDLFSRKVIGWDLSSDMLATRTHAAFIRALQHAQPGNRSIIFHSDQGSQYTEGPFRKRLKLMGFQQSMSRRGNCYDNAYVESFFHTLKNEIETPVFRTKKEAKETIFDYIETWYNSERIHSSLGYLSPVEYEQKHKHAA